MARIRSIKPEIHLDEDLWDAEVDSGLPLFRAFTGLWGQADREGRFEWRPRMLKAAILPYWDGDFSRVLDALTTRGFLVRYTSQGREIGLVRTFARHQVVNNREAASLLPPPPGEMADISKESTRAPRVSDACAARAVHALAERKGKEGKGKEGKGAPEAPPDPGTKPEDFAEVYRRATGNTDLPADPFAWRPRHQDAVSEMRLWCQGDLDRLAAELEALGSDTWLRKQAVHVWANRLGTGRKAPATPSGPGSSGMVSDPDFW